MSIISEHLLFTLNELESEELELFQWHLKNGVESFPSIPRAHLEKSTRHDTVDQVVQVYGQHGAVEITLAILKKMNHNQLAKQLRTKIKGCLSVAAVQILSSEPKTRGDFLKYFCGLTLDPNTAHHHLYLSENRRVVVNNGRVQPYSDHPERFERFFQVLSKESVCGRSYWEVDWSSDASVSISVSYKGIRRKGWSNECGLGANSQSWSLVCSSTLSFCHDTIQTKIPDPPPYRIGVYVDHSSGTLSFYRVSDTMSLLHTVHTTFTQPLYAGFWLSVHSVVTLCNPE
ncbi:tripartite motif-containing protein 16-like [Brachyhypopomus gauderio]|uniref:tripartite motif-containing protein 16-like n=1 Tax=Brachyhypopomus gauderio TaxID=698409 RepID=UPI0040421B97